jgi:hypothetical protein
MRPEPNSASASSVAEKGGAGFEAITMLLCENLLPPLPRAVEAATKDFLKEHGT